jgi:hypothetical protein
LDYLKRDAVEVRCDVVVYSQLGYAGTVDILWRDRAGRWTVDDLKTAQRVLPQAVQESHLQTTAYALALREVGYSVGAIAPVYITPAECKTFRVDDPLHLDALFLRWMNRLTQFRYEHSLP